MSNHIYSEQNNKINKGNKHINKEDNLQSIRLNFEKLMNSDMLAESYDILPSHEQYMNMRNINIGLKRNLLHLLASMPYKTTI
jgi:hypothetical protein